MTDPTPAQIAVDPAAATAAEIMEKLPETVARTIDVLSDKLSAPAEKLIAAAARYVWATGVAHLVIAAILVLVGVPVSILLLRELWKRTEGWRDEGLRQLNRLFGSLALAVAIGLCLGFALDLLSSGLPRLLAPDGAALVAILSGKGL